MDHSKILERLLALFVSALEYDGKQDAGAADHGNMMQCRHLSPQALVHENRPLQFQRQGQR